jgi:hypothetical protein
MNALAVAVVVLACVFGGVLAGLFLRARLPDHHLQDNSKEIIKLGIGVISTMAALVLGLLVSSAKGSFDRTGDELTQAAARIVQLDTVLAQYGVDATEVRGKLRRDYQRTVDALLSQEPSRLAELRAPKTGLGVENVQAAIRALTPAGDDQRLLRSQAQALAEEVGATRALLVLQQHKSISTPLLVVVVAWLTLIFVGFGLFTPRNATVIASLFLCALAVSGAIFLILEMDDPLAGMVRISDEPMRRALAILTNGGG